MATLQLINYHPFRVNIQSNKVHWAKSNHQIIGGVLKSMLASDVAIIDVKEHHIKHFEVIIELLREATSLSNRSS